MFELDFTETKLFVINSVAVAFTSGNTKCDSGILLLLLGDVTALAGCVWPLATNNEVNEITC